MIPTIAKECSQFLILSKGEALCKNLLSDGDGFKKVKVRKKKYDTKFVESFNGVFPDYTNLLQRAVFANTQDICSSKQEPFYIFPINGFKFMYNSEIKNTLRHYDEMHNKLTGWLNDDGNKVFSDVVRGNYQSTNLLKGITSNAEIIIYNIPYYYAIRKSLVDDYSRFIYDN